MVKSVSSLSARNGLRFLLLFLLVIVCAGPVTADDHSQPLLATTPEPRLQSYPWMSIERWYEMHAEDEALAHEGSARLVFLGDSITEAWQMDGLELWNQHFVPRDAVDFGIGGDMTHNLLWRLHNGAAGNLNPDAVVLLIGVNNLSFSKDSPEQIAQGVIANVNLVENVFPNADILLLGVFPYAESATDSARGDVRAINAVIQPLGERERVTYMDLDDLFLESDGSLSAEIMPDYLHLSAAGYQRWADAILPWVDQRVPLQD